MKNLILEDLYNIYTRYKCINQIIYKKYGKYTLKDINKYFGNFINAIYEYNKKYSTNIKIKEKDNRLIKIKRYTQEAKNKISKKHIQNWDQLRVNDLTYDELVYFIFDCYYNYHFVNLRNVCAKYFLKVDQVLDIIKDLARFNINSYKQLLIYIGIPLGKNINRLLLK